MDITKPPRIASVIHRIRVALSEGDGDPGYDTPIIREVRFYGFHPSLWYVESDASKSPSWEVNRAVSSALKRSGAEVSGLNISRFKKNHTPTVRDVSHLNPSATMSKPTYIPL